MRRPTITTIGLGLLAIASIVGAVAVAGAPSTFTAQERTVTVSRGVVQSTMSGSGNLTPAKAEKALAATDLRAPMAGTIAEINGSVGETAGSSSSDSSSSSSGSSGPSVAGGLGGSSSSSSGGSGFITLAQISRYKMDVSLSESDIGSVKVRQAATVTVNAALGEQFAAKVTHIGVLSSSSGGGSSSSAVSYPVTLTLSQTGKALKAGMSATADIVTDEVTGSVAIPSQALSGSTVTVEGKDGSRTTQRVETGVVGDSTTQVVSGLKVGDKVVIRSTAGAGVTSSGSDQTNNALRNRAGGGGGLGGGLGGGNGFGGGGGGGFAGPPPGGGP